MKLTYKDEQLTEHFRLSEFVHSQTASKLGIENTPSEVITRNIRKVAEFLEPIRVAYGKVIHVNSGYRCAELNKQVDGQKTSFHLKGLQADIEGFDSSKEENKKLFEIIKDAGVQFDQLIDEYGYKWVHIGLSDNEYRNMVLHLG